MLGTEIYELMPVWLMKCLVVQNSVTAMTSYQLTVATLVSYSVLLVILQRRPICKGERSYQPLKSIAHWRLM